jgi:hypothetical protein
MNAQRVALLALVAAIAAAVLAQAPELKRYLKMERM